MRSSVYLLPLLLVQALWLLAPGLLAGLLLARRDRVPAYLVVPVAGLVGCLCGYVTLWAFFAAHRLGDAAVAVFAAAALLSAPWIVLRRDLRAALRRLDVAAPLVLLLALTLTYAAVTFSCTIAPVAGQVNGFCHLSGFTGDNILPQLFADNVHHGDPRTVTWDWQGSDRPPLQSGVQLLQAPLTESPAWRVMSYEVLTVLLQVLWLPAMWGLLRALRVTTRAVALVIAVCAGTGLCFFNSVFTWPKLLPAALVLLACGVWFFDRRGWWSWTIGGLAAGAAMVAHGGVVFTLLPVGAALLLPRHRPSWASLGAAAAAALLMVAPWVAYQRLYDPPGDRLLKMHLAGIAEPDGRPLGELLRVRYGADGVTGALANKAANAATLFGVQDVQYQLLGHRRTSVVRDEEFRYLALSFGALTLGWLALLRRDARRRLRAAADPGRLRLVLGLAGASLAGWVLLMYGPSTTHLHQGSYATMLLLFAGAGVLFSTLPRWLTGFAVAAQAAYWALVWVAAVWKGHHLHWGYVTVSLVAVAAFAGTLLWLYRRGEDAAVEGAPERPVTAPRPAPAPA
ncbi:hypothetical protein Daura_37055 [Dactylosporangium aurantiacum]|uniref:Uncharacterized protein n=1 Tax=Dactylosporangium aurantiacum TaxID=35754 RepID=A0A9Q9IDV7_9ACTN|nr:hypothetical protein [Dactylosporangium aurantiacum]MDG6101976.1 hypothetical protein [Dactylosporangium aurantiacum]UWZ52237.1 hypothetical protein Daura_37055 [Dactylosporangium aurantiacum]